MHMHLCVVCLTTCITLPVYPHKSLCARFKVSAICLVLLQQGHGLLVITNLAKSCSQCCDHICSPQQSLNSCRQTENALWCIIHGPDSSHTLTHPQGLLVCHWLPVKTSLDMVKAYLRENVHQCPSHTCMSWFYSLCNASSSGMLNSVLSCTCITLDATCFAALSCTLGHRWWPG